MPNVDLEQACLSDEQLSDFRESLMKNRRVFANKPEELTQSTLPGHVIVTMDAVPVHQQPYKTNPTIKKRNRKIGTTTSRKWGI